ncbi:TRAP transporter substrate-binding protein DctP [Terrarubrum flagellatum]|uniref:TRAP transporter substrate-binding protein DctP n=1 Tax=Terrirubrum flagellatum TaxID=2895980 RepID=UPI0031450CC9
MQATRRLLLTGLMGSIAAPSAVRQGRAQQVATIRLAHVNQPTSEMHKVGAETAERVIARCAGRVAIKLFPAGQLGTTTEMIEQASQGEPIITYADAAYLSGFGVPELSILGGPFIVDSIVEGQRLAASSLVQGWCDRLAAKASVRVLALNWFDGQRHLIGKAAYPKPSDMKGVKIRVPPVPSWRKTFEPLGAIPTTVEASETYSALAQGVVAAAESPLLGIRANRWYEVVKNITLTAHFTLFTGWVMSSKAFDGLAEADRAILLEEFQKGGAEIARRADEKAAEVRREFEKEGVAFASADIPAYRDATRSFYAGFADWPKGLHEQVRAIAAAS